MEEPQHRQRRSLMVISIGILLFYIAGGTIDPQGNLFWAFTIKYPSVIKWAAFIAFAWYYYRFELYCGPDGRRDLIRFFRIARDQSAPVNAFDDREALARDWIYDFVRRKYADSEERWEDEAKLVSIHYFEHAKLDRASRVRTDQGDLIIEFPGVNTSVYDEAETVAPRVTVPKSVMRRAAMAAFKLGVLRDKGLSDYVVPNIVAAAALAVAIIYDFAPWIVSMTDTRGVFP